VPFILFLAFRWLAPAPGQVLFFILLQVSAALASMVAVFFNFVKQQNSHTGF